MTHWYREPKRVKLMEHLKRADLGFVLRSEDFSEDDLRKLRATPYLTRFREQVTLGTAESGDPKKVLVIAPRENPNLNWLENLQPWAGIFLLPSSHHLRQHALHSLFIINRAFHNGARGHRAVSKGVLHRFVLDMRVHPPSLYCLKESPEPLRCQQ
jgi:hypothetical protein